MNEAPQLYSQESELVIIGYLLQHNDEYWKLDGLEAKHFYFGVNQRIYQVIETLIRSNDVITPAVLKQHFEDAPELKEVSAAAYFSKAMIAATSLVSVHPYAKTVIDLFKRRIFRDEVGDIQARIDNPKPGETMDVLLGDLFSVCVKYSAETRHAKIHSYKEVTKRILDDMQNELPCYSTGIESLDRSMQGGVYSRKNYAIMARPKNGKTILLSTLAYNMAQSGVSTLYICAEMGEREIHQRVLGREIGDNSIAFIKKRKDQQFARSLVAASAQQSESCYYVDSPNISFSELQRVVMLGIKRYGIKGFFLDYLQLVSGKERHESTVEHHEKVASWLAKVVKEHDIFCIYTAQQNESGGARGGDAILMATDQLYSLEYDRTAKTAFMTMEATRYTPHLNVGNKDEPGLRLHNQGPHFKDYYVA